MAATSLQMMTRAARLIRVLGTDVLLTSQEAADGLYALNSMLDAWGVDRFMVYQIQQTTHSWASGSASRTIGVGGNFNVARPIKIEPQGNFFRDSSDNDYPVRVYPREVYDSIIGKTDGGSIPSCLFYDDGYPTRTLYAYPVPGETVTLHLNHWLPLQVFDTLTEEIALPPGYQAAIEENLAVFWAPEWGGAAMAAAQGLEKRAALLKSNLKSLNAPSLVATLDPAISATGDRFGSAGSSHIQSGYVD